MRRTRSQAGFTLVELMISLVLFSFAIAGVLAVAVSMAQGYRQQRQTVETESAARGAMDYIADATRQSSPGVSSAKVQGTPISTGTRIVVGDIQDTRDCAIGTVIVENQTSGPDSLEMIFASGGIVTSLRAPYDGTANQITVTSAGADQLREGDMLLITNGSQGHLVRIGTGAGSINVATGVIDLQTFACTPTLAVPYDAGSLVVRAMRAKFFIGPFDGSATALLMDPDPANNSAADVEPLADHVEDMQIAMGIDENANGTIDTSPPAVAHEWYFGGAAAPPADDALLRAVRITLTARASTPLTSGPSTFYRPGAEDRAASTVPDTYRRRVLSTTIEIRNLEASP